MSAVPDCFFITRPSTLDPWRLEAADGEPRPVDEIEVDLRRHSGRSRLVHLVGHHPARHPGLSEVMERCRALGLTPSLVGCPTDDGPRPPGLLALPLHGASDMHDARVGDPGAHRRTMALLDTGRCRVWSRPSTVADARAVAVAVRDRAEQLHLLGPLDAARLDAVLEHLRGSATSLHLEQAHVPPDVGDAPPRPREPQVLDLRLQGGWVPGLEAGLTAPCANPTLWAALGLAPCEPAFPLDLSGPVDVLVPALPDVLLATSTLPGLARALAERGRTVRMHSVWHAPWNLYGPSPGEALGTLTRSLPGRDSARLQAARRLEPRWLASLDLRDSGAVIVPGLSLARWAVDHPTRRPGTPVVAFDLHHRDGADRWRGAPAAAWSDLTVLSCFPGFAQNYLRDEFPLQRFRWVPYPVDLADLPPAPAGGDSWVAAGSHQRDHAVLAHVADHLGARGRRLRVFGAAPPRPHPATDHHGVVGLGALCQALREARAVLVLPRSSAEDPAGISIAALALAAGRPVVGTSCWGLRDHVPHGRAGVLVPADDPGALLAAMERLEDDTTLARFSEGATEAARRADVSALADQLTGRTLSAWPIRPS